MMNEILKDLEKKPQQIIDFIQRQQRALEDYKSLYSSQQVIIEAQKAELEKYEQIDEVITQLWNLLLKLSIVKRKEKPTLEEFAEAIQEIKAEAYKEFAKKLKEDFKNSTLWGLVSFDRINNLLKEMVGDSCE